MIFQPQALVQVYYNGQDERHLMGRLLFKDRKIFFEYEHAFIKLGLELSPFKLPLKNGVMATNDRMFDGLFGVFNDSLPDGWGRLLLDRKLMKMGFIPGNLSPLDRLCFVGNHGMGALSYEPEHVGEPAIHHADFDEIYSEIQNFQENDDYFLDDLLTLGGSSAGARPKILINFQSDDWLVKFKSTVDPKDIGNIEYAYHLMAKESGLDVPEAMLFPSKKSSGYFGVKRFDLKDNRRIHMHTAAGLLHADHREPSLDYEMLLKATLFLTRDVQECEKMYRMAVFNVLSHNRDDHSKNFSFLMGAKGIWTVSPAYDLVFSSGPGGEHATLIMGEGKNPELSHFLKLADIGDIKSARATEIMGEVQSGISKWLQCSDIAGVSKLSRKTIQDTLSGIKKQCVK